MFYYGFITALIIVFAILVVVDICFARPKYEVVLDDVGNLYLKKGDNLFHIFGWDNYCVFIIDDNKKIKRAIPNKDILSLGLLHNEKAGD